MNSEAFYVIVQFNKREKVHHTHTMQKPSKSKLLNSIKTPEFLFLPLSMSFELVHGPVVLSGFIFIKYTFFNPFFELLGIKIP